MAEFRRLAPGSARPLIACSGGADSCALVLAIASAFPQAVVAHVVHDLRPRKQALADRDVAKALAASLGLWFVQGKAEVRAAGGNAEGAARRLRYAALLRLAREHTCDAVLSAHHADDQLETMLMALIRGSGPAGLRGVRARRKLVSGATGGSSTSAPSIALIRPMLQTTRADARALCRQMGVEWAEDATNADTRRLRAALRARVLPILEELRPGASRRAARSAALIAVASDALGRAGAAVLRRAEQSKSSIAWERSRLRTAPAPVVGEALRLAFGKLARGESMDDLSGRIIDGAVNAIGDARTQPRTFQWPAGIKLSVTAKKVTLSR